MILSATSWAIIIYKWWELAGASEDSEAFLEIYHEKPLEIAYDAARDLDRIFERFYRVDKARSRVTGGSGLGLAIVRHVAGNHGGDVLVQSQEGEGSTFVLRLPLSLLVTDAGSSSATDTPAAAPTTARTHEEAPS